jgi:hypothetical protein
MPWWETKAMRGGPGIGRWRHAELGRFARLFQLRTRWHYQSMTIGRLYRDRTPFQKMVAAGLTALSRTAQIFWLGSLMTGAWMTIMEGVVWLHTGNWPGWTMKIGLSAVSVELPKSNWVLVEHCSKWFNTVPLPVGVILLGLMCALILLLIASVPGRRN